ncbi:MAG: pyruvate, phosphate dikinase [Candidatus Diapherotrites archaeon]|nr:pyruvate, phosphate dikinase [Candidatus Diapherotrites archaeon]
MKKYVYSFDEVPKPNTWEWIFKLGNKGAQLAEMTKAGLPVPPGFTITTEACNEFYKLGKRWPAGLEKQVKEAMKKLERKTGKKFGSDKEPLFVSVRSGSYVSMPGMMDTILNLGMNDKTVEAFAKLTNNERAAWDSYRRFIQMFGNVVMGIPHEKFEEILDEVKRNKGVENDTDLDAEDLKEVVKRYKELVKKEKGRLFPQDVWQQLKMAIDAVFNSWNNPRAIAYRRINKLREDAGTGVNVQAMVFGNMGNDSGTGVAFTRNPATGAKEHYGEFLLNAQGEDVVAGIRTPQPIDAMKKILPKAYKQLLKVYEKLEKHYKDLQDFEFTIERGKLYLLQTRTGKRTAQAAVKIAVDMVKEGLISKKEALLRIKPEQIDMLLHKQLDEVAKKEAQLIAKGIAASPGAAVGKVVFNAEEAKRIVEQDPNEKIILVRTETSPEDIEGMHAAQGILTARGGATSHAAVVARGMGKCCVAGSNDITVYEKKGYFITKDGLKIKKGEWISLDGSTGEVFAGKLALVEPKLSKEFKQLLKWADEYRKLGIRTNADTPKDAKIAREFGAEGIGLCRTEHMFFEGQRIKAMREMILANTKEERRKALAKLLPYQRKDFYEIFKVMDGLPVTIRLLDPPLHEFLPQTEKEIKELAKEMKVSVNKIKAIIKALEEFNPMLGFRGVRLAIVYPEIAEMQVRAIIEAAIKAKKEGIRVKPEIMVPLVAHATEMKRMRELIEQVAKEIMEKAGVKISYKIGTMVELPRAALTADELAEYAEFFSFGTNDLTQTTLGYSRDDAAKFIPKYIEEKILAADPFQTLDTSGVGQLIEIAKEKGTKTRKDIKLGICGEHGGDAASIEFCHKVGLTYVSCSPFRVPIARIAAAQAAIKAGKR